jgi:hypothetical protein
MNIGGRFIVKTKTIHQKKKSTIILRELRNYGGKMRKRF